ncbi:MAG TPA: Maf family protein [Rhizomicrobium sp.]|nr:Maf family protein [Rhizomicrobium sp.]
MTGLVLASSSHSRQMLLTAAGVAFRVVPADIAEEALMAELSAKGCDAADVAVNLAEAKAITVSHHCPGELVLGGDSVLAFGPDLISKCRDLDALRMLLKRLRGETHELLSAASLARDGVRLWRHVGRARLTMRPFSDAFLDQYLAAEGETVLSCVGGYRYEGPGAQLFAQVEGDYFTILGLPLLPVLAALRAQGFLAS